jgi:ubiquinone/menaquinone biosynthesis C-methylase UbiE
LSGPAKPASADALAAAKAKAERTYNAAADSFDAAPLAFWDRFGRGTIERLSLRPGARVLDVACGSGASALPAAHAVGVDGRVLAVDLAADLLELGRAKAAAQGLTTIEFRRGDMTALGLPDGGFDAVVCVFGIFFVPDMEAQVAELWRLVAPGGQLAITTWGPGFAAPAYGLWQAHVQRLRPDLHSSFNPWDRITTVDAVRKLMADGGVPVAHVQGYDALQALYGAEDFWTIVKGSGLRWVIEQMRDDEAQRLHDSVIADLERLGVGSVETNVIYARARRRNRIDA